METPGVAHGGSDEAPVAVEVDAAVVGGGIAGVRTALGLTRLGYRVALFERASSLGGRAGSHPDRKKRVLDLGQHVYMGCCLEYRRFLAELGADSLAPLEAKLSIPLIDAGRAHPAEERLQAAPLPHPLSLAGAVLRYGHLRPAERVRTLWVVMRAKAEYLKQRDERGYSFWDWLKGLGVGENEAAALWEPLILAALNSMPKEVDAAPGIMVLAEGLAGGKKSAVLGVPRAPLSRLLEPAIEAMRPKGAVYTGAPVSSLLLRDGRVFGLVLRDGSRVRARAVALAVGHRDVAPLLPEPLRDRPFFSRLRSLKTRPIVNVHLWYRQALTPSPMVGFIRSPLQWLFDVTALHGEEKPGGRHYVVSLSGAEEPMRADAPALIDAMTRELSHVFGPRAADATDAAVRKVRHATFLCAPGSEALRPPNETPIPGLFLAGDYTATGWPSTMESAVRSGRAAAQAAASYLAGYPNPR